MKFMRENSPHKTAKEYITNFVPKLKQDHLFPKFVTGRVHKMLGQGRDPVTGKFFSSQDSQNFMNQADEIKKRRDMA
jgi:hypothetical protein